jgi:hypothetical protein
MQHSFKLAIQAGEPSLVVHTATALIVVVLFTLTFAALEVSLSGDESLSAVEAVIGGWLNATTGITNERVDDSDCPSLSFD